MFGCLFLHTLVDMVGVLSHSQTLADLVHKNWHLNVLVTCFCLMCDIGHFLMFVCLESFLFTFLYLCLNIFLFLVDSFSYQFVGSDYI